MTTTMNTPVAQTHSGVRFDRVVLAEWTKFRSVRSTIWSLAVMVLFVIGIPALAALAVVQNSGDPQLGDDGQSPEAILGLTTIGAELAPLVLLVLGTLAITSEYSKGGIRSTLTAVPSRLEVLAAKAVVLAAVSFLAAFLSLLMAFALVQAIVAGQGWDISLGEPQALRCLVGGGLYLTGSALFGFALGVLIRHSAGAITTGVAALFLIPAIILPIILGLIPGEKGDALLEYVTSGAGRLIMNPTSPGNMGDLGPWSGYGVFTVQWLIVLAIGAVLMIRRDA